MGRMEHWAHRLYPKLPFDDVMDRIAQLGKKMAVSTYVKKLRLGMVAVDPQGRGEDEKENQEEEEDNAVRSVRSHFPPPARLFF